MSTQPKIDDQFWFDMSYEMVKDAVKRLKEGAAKLQTLLQWAFGIYTASAVFTVEYKNVEEVGILLILCLPYIFLILGYWYSHVAQFPVTVKFDYRSPTLIEKAYTTSFTKSEKQLNIAKWLTFTGLVVLSVSLMTAYVLKNQSHDEAYLTTNLNKESWLFEVTGSFPAEKELHVKMLTISKKDTIESFSDKFLNPKSGDFMKSYAIDSLTTKIYFEVGWDDKDLKHTIAKELKVLKQGK
jgi:hypothetical protein